MAEASFFIDVVVLAGWVHYSPHTSLRVLVSQVGTSRSWIIKRCTTRLTAPVSGFSAWKGHGGSESL